VPFSEALGGATGRGSTRYIKEMANCMHRGPLDSGSESISEAEEFDDDDDSRKIWRIKHAIDRKERMTGIIIGQYNWQGRLEEVQFQKVLVSGAPPDDVIQPLADMHVGIVKLGSAVGGVRFPHSLGTEACPREDLEISVGRVGR
jgi:hypothetical protein